MLSLERVLVCIPYRASTNPKLVECAQDLFNNLTYPSKTLAMYKNDYPRTPDYASNALARNDMVETYVVNGDYSHVLWCDVDLSYYPPDLIERLHATSDIAAPIVLMDRQHIFYDIAGFIQDGKRVSADPPFFDVDKPLDSVGTCYLIPSEVYRDRQCVDAKQGYPYTRVGARYAARPERHLTEHWVVMEEARTRGYKIGVCEHAVAFHAFLPSFQMDWHRETPTQ